MKIVVPMKICDIDIDIDLEVEVEVEVVESDLDSESEVGGTVSTLGPGVEDADADADEVSCDAIGCFLLSFSFSEMSIRLIFFPCCCSPSSEAFRLLTPIKLRISLTPN